MEQEKNKQPENFSETILRERLKLALGGVDPSWTAARVSAVFARESKDSEFLQAVLALIADMADNLRNQAAAPGIGDEVRNHTCGGIFHINQLRELILRTHEKALKELYTAK